MTNVLNLVRRAPQLNPNRFELTAVAIKALQPCIVEYAENNAEPENNTLSGSFGLSLDPAPKISEAVTPADPGARIIGQISEYLVQNGVPHEFVGKNKYWSDDKYYSSAGTLKIYDPSKRELLFAVTPINTPQSLDHLAIMPAKAAQTAVAFNLLMDLAVHLAQRNGANLFWDFSLTGFMYRVEDKAWFELQEKEQQIDPSLEERIAKGRIKAARNGGFDGDTSFIKGDE